MGFCSVYSSQTKWQAQHKRESNLKISFYPGHETWLHWSKCFFRPMRDAFLEQICQSSMCRIRNNTLIAPNGPRSFLDLKPDAMAWFHCQWTNRLISWIHNYWQALACTVHNLLSQWWVSREWRMHFFASLLRLHVFPTCYAIQSLRHRLCYALFLHKPLHIGPSLILALLVLTARCPLESTAIGFLFCIRW